MHGIKKIVYIDYINDNFPSKHTSYISLPLSPFPLKLVRSGFKISSVLCIFCLSLLDLEVNRGHPCLGLAAIFAGMLYNVQYPEYHAR